MRNSSQHPFTTSQPKFLSPNSHITTKQPPFTDITKSNTLTPPQQKSSNSHVRTSSFSISLHPLSQSPFSNNSLALEPSHKPLGHRRGNSFSQPENTSSTFITRFPTSFQDDSCNIPSTLRNNQGKENRPSGLYAPSLTSSLLLNESSLKHPPPTNSPFRHQQREPSTQSPYRTDASNNFVSNPFSKQPQQQPPFEMTFTSASAFNNHLNYSKPSAKPDDFREVNETLHSFPHAGFFEMAPKQLDTEERLPTELGMDSIYHSPPKTYQQQYIGSPELLRMQGVSRPSNYNIQNTTAERFSFEGKGHQGDSSVVYFCSKGTLNETSFRDPLTNTKELLVPQQAAPKNPESPEISRSLSPEDKQVLESPHPSDYILSIASNRDPRSARSHQIKSVCSQQLSSKRENTAMPMPEVKFFRDRFPVISHNLPSQSQEDSNKQEASIHHHQEEEIMVECKKFSITEIMEEVKKIEKNCENKPNTQILDFPESARQLLLPTTLEVIPEDPQQPTEATPLYRNKGPEPLFCDESTILFNSQSATLVTSPNKFDRKIEKLALGGQVDDSDSITNFTLKTEPKLSERSHRENPPAPVSLSERVNLVLKKLGEKLKTAEEIHQHSHLLSFQKDTKINSVYKALPQEQEFHTFDLKKNDFKEIEVYSFGAKEVTPSSIKDSEGFQSNGEKSVQDLVRDEMAKVKESLMKYKAVIEPQNVSSFRKMDTMSLEDTLRGTGGVECYEESESDAMKSRASKPPSYNFERFNHSQSKRIHNDNPDLIAHIEYNYKPLNPIIYEESQERTYIATPDGTPCKKENALVDLYGTAQETAFALPNYETAKELNFQTLEREIGNKMGEYQQEISQKLSDISLRPLHA